MSRHRLSALALASMLAACSDAPARRTLAPEANFNESEGRGVFQRYVAIGTSVSMGWRSDGVVAESQRTSWPAQLGRMGHREITQAYLSGFGCRSPLVAPLARGVRTSGEPAAIDGASVACAALDAEVVLPTQNLAISSATTFDALRVTAATHPDPFYTRLYAQVLLPGATQVTSMMTQNPKLVSVELGANEVLNARSGIAIEGATLFPYQAWVPLYDEVLDSVAAVTKMGLLTGLIRDVGDFPSFRRGAELYGDRATFLAAFNVAVSADCAESDNLLFVPVRVPTAVATGAVFRQRGLGPAPLSCAAGPATAQDFVLTPDEAARVNALMHAMTSRIQAKAAQLGYAYFELEALYGRAGVKPPFSVLALMTSETPYGAYLSLDGLHPSALGATVLAEAAARALNERYGLGIVVDAAPTAVLAVR